MSYRKQRILRLKPLLKLFEHIIKKVMGFTFGTIVKKVDDIIKLEAIVEKVIDPTY